MSEATVAQNPVTAASNHLARSGAALLAAATGLLVWGTAFDGRSFGPIRFLLRATPHGDKVGHFVLYGAIVFAVSLVLRKRTTSLAAAFVMLIVGIADEYRQLFLGGRNFDLDDVLANAGGICLGLLAALVIMGKVAGRSFDVQEESAIHPSSGVVGWSISRLPLRGRDLREWRRRG